MYGEKGSGKSTGGVHALIRHCYEEYDALALVIAPAIRSGKEGVFYELEKALDIWKNGNLDKFGNRTDEGMGIDYTESTLDPSTKDRILYIANKHGGWSKVVLISIPYPSMVEKRMKAISPSFVYVDEITELESAEYFTYVTLQIGRRPNIVGPQQYYASCNPEGPSHWVYKTFFEDCVDAETGVRDPQYCVLHVPIQENAHNLPDGYLEKITSVLKDDIDYKRLILGVWIDRPSGDAIFKNYFNPGIHVRGTPSKGIGLMPWRSLPIWIGHDPGPNNYSIHFEQMIPSRDGKTTWIVFDELNFVGEARPDFYVAGRLVERLDFWKEKTGGTCQFIHIADQSAFSHKRSDGNYDATRMKALTKGRVIMRPFAPEGVDSKGSVAARVQMLRNMFINETLFISALCSKTVDAMRLLASEKPKYGKYDDMAGFKPKRSIYLHPFDSLSYPIFYTQMFPSAFIPQTGAPSHSGVYRAGGG
jgi:hypothetical protein